MEELLVSVEDAARALGVGRSLAYELIASGQLARVKLGRRTLVPVRALHEYVERMALASRVAMDGSASAQTESGVMEVRPERFVLKAS